MKKINRGVVHLGVVVVVVVALIGVLVFFLFPRDPGRSGSPPWGRFISNDKVDPNDTCGNALGNGDEIVTGAKKGEKDHDQDNPFRSLTVHPTDPNILYVGTERNGILKSEDGGKNWERLRYGIRHDRNGYPEVYDMAIAESNPDIIYAAITEGPGPVAGNAPSSNGGVYRSSDAGITWERKNCGLSSGAILAVWVDPKDENHAVIALDAGEVTYDFPGVEKGFYPGGIFQTFDGGEMWGEISGPENIGNNSYIHVKGSESVIYTVGTFGRRRDNPSKNLGLVKSIDNGETWQLTGQSVSDKVGGYFDVSSDGKTIYASSGEFGIWASEDGGGDWKRKLDRGYIYTPIVDPTNAKRALFGMGNELFLTEDGFDSSINVISRSSRETVHFSDIVFAPSDSSTVYAIAAGYDLYKSSDSGRSFIKLGNLREDVLDKIP